jgi:hypothetical protein
MGTLPVNIEETIVPAGEYNANSNNWWDYWWHHVETVWLGLEYIGIVLCFLGSTVIYAAIWDVHVGIVYIPIRFCRPGNRNMDLIRLF